MKRRRTREEMQADFDAWILKGREKERKAAVRQETEKGSDWRIAGLKAKIADYKQHECSYDEREGACPVCRDIDILENELACAKLARGDY